MQAERIALVTGGSRGIGRAICLALANSHTRVIINYVSKEDDARLTAKMIRDTGALDPVIMRFDVADPTQVDGAIGRIQEEIGGIDILVNNAAISKDNLLVRVKNDEWRQMMAINLDGVFYCARACTKHMIKNRFGRIINISSVVAESGHAGQTAYVTAKAGILGLTKSLARELASRNITVNAVTPGYIETDMTAVMTPQQKEKLLENIPLGMIGKPEDVAGVVRFLASDEARYITGHALAVNGGMYM